MKKFWLTLVLCLTCAFCAVGFTGCSGGAVEFKINFVVDGEIYATVNTNGAETIKMPDNPTKDDYTFDGWFWDKDVWEKPFTANSLLDAPLSSDMSVYAKWKSNHNFIEQITKQPTCTEKGEKTFTCECGYSYTKEINALGHKFTNYVSDNNATYEKDGTKTAVCDRGCGATDTITDVGSKLPEITEYFEKRQDGTYYGKVYNTTNTFDFTGKIDYDGEYLVCTDAACRQPLADNKTSLNVGDNTFYILYDNGNKATATVRRRAICTVTFDTANGTTVAPQTVEEDRRTPAPKNPMRLGYTFNAWDYDFNKPISENTTITALWNANTNTPYKVEYYLQNLENDEYTLQENDTENLTGTTDTTATATTTKTYEHFTVIESTASANINPDGTTVLKFYYNLDTYTVKILASNDDISLSNTFNGQYKYGYVIPEIQVNVKLGYNCDNEFVTEDSTIPSFTVDKNINYVANCSVKEEMLNFNFTSTVTACTITGIKDKTITKIIIPDYITSIGSYAFNGCSSLPNITIPDSVTSIGHGAFCGCFNLTSIIIPNSVTTISIQAFYGCSGLTSITIPDKVTRIETNEFLDCSSLTSITIPDSITSIGSGAFQNCIRLTSITYKGTIAQWQAINKDNVWKNRVPSSCKVHCTDGDLYI